MPAVRQLQIVLLFAFLIRLLYLYCFPLHMTDYMLINSAAQNLIDGHGMGFIKSSAQDLSVFYFEGLRLWPPLVTALTAFSLNITGDNAMADLLMITLVLTGFVWILYLLCKEIGLKTQYMLYVFIVFAINPELIKRPGFSDLAAALFALISILFLCRQLKGKKQFGYRITLWIAFLFFLPSAFRYQYYPVSLSFPIFMLLASLYLKDNTLTKRSAASFLFVLLLLIAQECFLFVYTTQPLHESVAMDETGFFPFNLQNSYPLFIKTFINVSYIENTWKHIISPLRYYYFAVAALLLILYSFFCIRVIISKIAEKKQSSKDIEVRQTVAVLSLLFFLLLPIGILIALSITHNSRTGLPGGWTYVNEGRYYILPSVLLLVLTFWMVQHKWYSIKQTLKKILLTLFVATTLYNLVLTGKFIYNAALNNIPDKELSNRNDRAAVYEYLKLVNEDTTPTVLAYIEPYFTFFPHLKNVAIVNNIDLLNGIKLSTSKKIRLLIISQKNPSETELAFIKHHGATPVLYRTNCTLYATTINPQ